MNFRNGINQLILNPQKIFLIDGIGAALSAFFLGVLLVQFDSVFGMPKEKLYFLASIALFFMTYSLFCCLFFPKKWKLFLAIIASSNLLYSLFTIHLIISLYENLTFWDLTYFIVEVIILIILVWIEFKATKN